MTRPDDDPDLATAWREIVENFGERAQLDPEPAPEPPPQPPAASPEDYVAELDDLDEDEPFVPPPPPPLPRPAPRRLVAWAGVFGAPVVLLIALILSWTLPRLLSYGLVAWFVGGFVFLVLSMPRGPRDPWDNGARL